MNFRIYSGNQLELEHMFNILYKLFTQYLSCKIESRIGFVGFVGGKNQKSADPVGVCTETVAPSFLSHAQFFFLLQ